MLSERPEATPFEGSQPGAQVAAPRERNSGHAATASRLARRVLDELLSLQVCIEDHQVPLPFIMVTAAAVGVEADLVIYMP